MAALYDSLNMLGSGFWPFWGLDDPIYPYTKLVADKRKGKDRSSMKPLM